MIFVFLLCLGIAALIISTANRKGEETLGWVLACFVILSAFMLSTLLALVIGILIELIMVFIRKREADQEKPTHPVLYSILGIASVMIIIFGLLAFLGNMAMATL